MEAGREGRLEEAVGLEGPVTRVFIDANIIFSAAQYPESRLAALIVHSKDMGLRCLCSPAVVEEAVKNLKKKHPKGLPQVAKLLAHMEHVQAIPGSVCPVALADKDHHVFLAAVAGKADVLITGDLKDFGHLMNNPKKSAGILIQTFTQFVVALQRGR